ncbi:MAG: hypothetical protein KAH93_06060 [Candidatus Aenigmarchaeota archaeon]|nr:hypothetical protein [Candidatus Aenigmarchaeota archaeon]
MSVYGEVFYDVCLLSGSYGSLNDDVLFTEHQYSLLNVGHLSEQKIEDLIDKLVGGFTDFNSRDSCLSVRVRYAYTMYDDNELTYLAVCGQCPKNCHKDLKREVRAKVREIAVGSSAIHMEKPVNLSVRKKINKPNLFIYRPR